MTSTRAIKVAVLHGAVPPDAPPDERDTLIQVEAVSAALRRLGYAPEPVPFSLDLEAVLHALQRLDPAFVFNLAESVAGSGRPRCTVKISTGSPCATICAVAASAKSCCWKPSA
ncbi:MAG: hypothetical protein KGJ12_01910 [Gammaproteobacteria bacterium]|nr:hypothetical protein [Gammaproteobacteria bacterium]